MPQKLFKAKKRKIAPKRPTVEEPKKIVLVGTYSESQLEDWPGYYNYPLSKSDKIDAEACTRVNEIWLFKGTQEPRYFAAEFVGIRTRDELKALGYPAKGRGHGDGTYLLFRIAKTYAPSNASAALAAAVERVIIRLKDFARSPKVRKQLKAYLESPDRNDPDLANQLPSIVTKVPRNLLRVCDAAVQMEFLPVLTTIVHKFGSTTKKPNYHIASLFAGCGGMDLGFVGGFEFLGKEYDPTGFDIVWANEVNPAACKTYQLNLGGPIVCADIKEVVDSIPKNVDIVMGGFPCQDISINGKMLGIKGERSCLYKYIVEAVRKLQPKVFIAENVGSLLLKQNEYSFKTILKDFQSLNYDVSYHVYHAEDYGVPQTRERIVFVGTRCDMPQFECPKPLKDSPVTAGEALHDLENRAQDKEFSHIWSAAAPSGEQGSRRMVANRPGYTIRAECHGNIQFHYRLPRRISMREAARIQSFPDAFMFPCGIRETERQIGNAVPPVLAWHIAQSVKRVLDKGANEQG